MILPLKGKKPERFRFKPSSGYEKKKLKDRRECLHFKYSPPMDITLKPFQWLWAGLDQGIC